MDRADLCDDNLENSEHGNDSLRNDPRSARNQSLIPYKAEEAAVGAG